MRLFSKSLAIGLPASRVDAYLRRPDSVRGRRNEMDKHVQENMQIHLDLAHLRIRELEQRQEYVCTNGKFLWKISSYLQLFQQSATKKEKEKFCSPPFYTGQYGYKLRAEAFLNGLGQGKGTHLSLYVVIMKGEYDAILPWPFHQRVDFVLIDQDDDIGVRQNKIWRLSCDRDSDYFKRPNKVKSLGFGCPKFVSLDTLRTRHYIRDNTIFIRIDVDPVDAS
ncbi:TNF receptor-associated factor 5-like [Montipora capricornis]|uniref:TNF receptor-associated factor 5-like n=1 Tax=Montipora capricornis TaxID=246305 RepID=UPI0035F1F762